MADATLLATIVSTCSNDGGGGGGASVGGLFLHTFGCAYFKFFDNIVLPHKLHVPVFGSGILTCNESFELSSVFNISSATSSGMTTGLSSSGSGIFTSLGISVMTMRFYFDLVFDNINYFYLSWHFYILY